MTVSSRREFLCDAGRGGLAALLAWEFALDAIAAPAAAPTTTAGGILELRLQATRLSEMAGFYGELMGWPVERSGGSLVVHAGGTRIRFDPAADGTTPYYHVAWAIPSNKFATGKAWLSGRLPLLVHPDGRDEFHFRSVNRRAVFFGDPAGNILELIARDDLGDKRPGGFGLDDILYVNHAGLAVADMDVAIEQLRSGAGLEPRQDPEPTFATLGDAHRHVTLVPTGRLWLPEMNRGAEVFPADIVMHGDDRARFALPGHPYAVTVQSRPGRRATLCFP